MDTPKSSVAASFQLHYASLVSQGRALTFPCDEKGCVDLAALPERAKTNYLFARGMVGRDYSPPCICRAVASH